MVDALNFLSLEFGVIPLGLAKTFAATSCEQIISGNPQSKAGMYWITNGTTMQQEYCNFWVTKLYCPYKINFIDMCRGSNFFC